MVRRSVDPVPAVRLPSQSPVPDGTAGCDVENRSVDFWTMKWGHDTVFFRVLEPWRDGAAFLAGLELRLPGRSGSARFNEWRYGGWSEEFSCHTDQRAFVAVNVGAERSRSMPRERSLRCVEQAATMTKCAGEISSTAHPRPRAWSWRPWRGLTGRTSAGLSADALPCQPSPRAP